MEMVTSDQCTAVTRDLQLGPHVGDCKSDVDFGGDEVLAAHLCDCLVIEDSSDCRIPRRHQGFLGLLTF